jgi:hypothetical protein
MEDQCSICHRYYEGIDGWEGCPDCRKKYPSSLLKAVCDPFYYALGLKDGTIIEFTEANIEGDWVTLLGQEQMGDHPLEKSLYGYRFYRGIQIRYDQIIWCADAPHGS